MQRPIRKLIGAIVLISFVTLYALVVMTIAVAKVQGASHLAQLAFFAVAVPLLRS